MIHSLGVFFTKSFGIWVFSIDRFLWLEVAWVMQSLPFWLTKALWMSLWSGVDWDKETLYCIVFYTGNGRVPCHFREDAVEAGCFAWHSDRWWFAVVHLFYSDDTIFWVIGERRVLLILLLFCGAFIWFMGCKTTLINLILLVLVWRKRRSINLLCLQVVKQRSSCLCI